MKKGFTLVELLVVIAIIAILSVVGAVIYSNLQKGARDVKRRADVNAISKAYEVIYSASGKYAALSSASFSGGKPKDPTKGEYYNWLDSNGAGFKVCAALENNPGNACNTSAENCYCVTSSQENLPQNSVADTSSYTGGLGSAGANGSNLSGGFGSTVTSTSVPSEYIVKPYLVYPADKPVYPEYETAVKNYMSELQAWYKQKVGKTFYMLPLKVVRSSYSYDIMRCDPNPNDSIPSSDACLKDPKRLDGNWGYYLNKAIHDGVEKWEEKTAALIFSAGGGGFAGANKYPNDTGFAITGDWVLEPISGKANDWGIPCKYSDGWQCAGGVPGGSPAHELGHAFGLPHPGGQYADQSIMEWHGGYPTVGFLPSEVDQLKKSPFFK